MRRTSRVLIALGGALVTTASWAQQPNAAFASKTVQQEMRQASSARDYEVLARYFRAQEQLYRTTAESDKEQRERALHTIAIPKFPAPADTAKWNLEQHENYADRSAGLADRYQRQLAAASGSLVANTGAASSYTPTQREVLAQIATLKKRAKPFSR